MRLPRFSGRMVAMGALTMAPLVFVVCFLLGLRICFAATPRGLGWTELGVIYMTLLTSMDIGLYFRRPLIDSTPRWGIFARRERPRPRLWMLLVRIALLERRTDGWHTI